MRRWTALLTRNLALGIDELGGVQQRAAGVALVAARVLVLAPASGVRWHSHVTVPHDSMPTVQRAVNRQARRTPPASLLAEQNI
jgi:hypothetical protein